MLKRLFGAALALALLPLAGLAVEIEGLRGFDPAPVANMPQFNTWLLGLNAELKLPPQDLAALSFRASQALSMTPDGATARFDAPTGRIELVSPTLAQPMALPLSSLPEFRQSLAQTGAQARGWLEELGRTSDPVEVSESLNAFFERSAVLDPQAHTTNVLAGKLPEHVRTAYDPTAAQRQKATLAEWQRSPTRTYVLVNSYSFKDDGTPGLNYYDMRSLAQILWASDPGVNVIFVTALPVDESMIKHVLRGHKDAAEIRKRVHFVSLDDEGTDFLSQKLLDKKHEGKLAEIRGLIERIGSPAVLYPYMGGPYEWRIARELGIPDSVYASHPTMFYWGSKSGGRKVANAAMQRYRGGKKVRIQIADGAEDLYDADAAARAIGDLQQRHPGIQKIAFKLNLGSSGEGNLFPNVASWAQMTHEQRRMALRLALDAARVGIPNEDGSIDTFHSMMRNEGAAVEQFIPGIENATFPSVQSEILPDGTVRVISSHEQILIDRNNYVGAHLSADKAYRRVIEKFALEVAKELAARGVVGRFGTDFAAIKQADGSYDVYFIENNIRLTGTTHPMVAAAGLAGGVYKRGAVRGDLGAVRYKSMDHDVRPNLVGMSVDRFLSYFERRENQDVLFDPQKRSGVLFHLVPAVKAAGNVGYTIIGETRKAVAAIQKRLTEQLNRLELEYLTGARHEDLRYRFAGKDVRSEVEEEIGHANMVRTFKQFLANHGEELYTRGAKKGIIFHPTGYTVLGRSQKELDQLDRKAQRFLERFRQAAIQIF